MSPGNLPPRKQPSPGHAPDPGAFERWFALGFVLLFLGILVAEVVRDYTPLKLSILFFLAARLLLTALHESGHALVAWLLGWRVHHLVIGMGKPAWTFRLRGVPVIVNKLPFGGHVVLTPRHLRQVRLRSALIYLAGPGSELLLGLALLLAFGPATIFARHTEWPVIAAQATLAAIALDAVFNLIPITILKDELVGAGTPNDGLGIILSFRWPLSHFERQLRQGER